MREINPASAYASGNVSLMSSTYGICANLECRGHKERGEEWRRRYDRGARARRAQNRDANKIWIEFYLNGAAQHRSRVIDWRRHAIDAIRTGLDAARLARDHPDLDFATETIETTHRPPTTCERHKPPTRGGKIEDTTSTRGSAGMPLTR